MARLKRRPLVKQLLTDRPANLLAVSSLGSPTWDLTASGDDPRNFCFIGAMGQAAPFALGLAIAQPEKRVVLFAGDGETLMALGALATIANQAPPNLTIVVLDNESYVETGSQPTATAGKTNLEAVAAGCGFEVSRTITKADEVDSLRALIVSGPGPNFVNVKIDAENLPLAFPHSFDGATAINRFRTAATS
ncbi:MAG: thiamine pyrophosphate-dependent enzyme [Burkholderiaceae bacterium]